MTKQHVESVYAGNSYDRYGNSYDIYGNSYDRYGNSYDNEEASDSNLLTSTGQLTMPSGGRVSPPQHMRQESSAWLVSGKEGQMLG